jgi:glycerophosphoryl diester phosphodiesterase
MRYCSKIFPLLFTILFAYSCSKDPAIYETTNLNGNTISAFGHAGMGLGFKYPIDSYESIEPCLRIGSDGSEMDIQMTKDSVLLVYHHKYLEEGTLCEGTINDKLWSEIWGCHHASPYSSKINLTSFDDLMRDLSSANYNATDFTFTFDCKLYTHTSNWNLYLNQYANAILKAMDDYQLQNNLLIESQDTNLLRILQNKRNGLKLFIYPNNFTTGLAIAKSMNLYGITIHTDEISESQVKLAHDNGFRITLWGVNSEKSNIEAIAKSPDFVQSDKIIHLLKIFGKYKHNINKII